MITYRRNGNSISAYYINQAGEYFKVDFETLANEGIHTHTDMLEWNQAGENYSYSRVGWEPFYIQPVYHYRSPRSLKPDGELITDEDFRVQKEEHDTSYSYN